MDATGLDRALAAKFAGMRHRPTKKPAGVVAAVVPAPRKPAGKVAVAVVGKRSEAPAPKGKVKVVPYKTDDATGLARLAALRDCR